MGYSASRNSMTTDSMVFVMTSLREVIPRKKLLPFGHCPKGGGVQPESKSFGVVFFGPSFGHYGGKGGGLNLFQKFLGSFWVVLR